MSRQRGETPDMLLTYREDASELQLTNGRSHKLAVEVFEPRQLQVTVILGFKHPRNPAAGCICLHASWRLNMFIRWYP